MPEGSTTCSLCNRVVEADHVNTSGRCVFCAGVKADEDEDDED